MQTAAKIERRRAAYETAKKALIAACAAHLRTIADDAELCAAIAHPKHVPVALLIDALRSVSVENTDISDSRNSFGEIPTYGASLSVIVFERRRTYRRHLHVDIPLGTVESPTEYAAWRAEKIGRTEADRISRARTLCRERREIGAKIAVLPPELQRIALGGKARP